MTTRTTKSLVAEAKKISDARFRTGDESLDAARYAAVVEELTKRGVWWW